MSIIKRWGNWIRKATARSGDSHQRTGAGRKRRRAADSSRGRFFEQLEPRQMLEGATFVHPGILSTAADFTRMTAQVQAQAQPWLSAYNKLTSDGAAQLNESPTPLQTVIRGGTGQNFGTLTWNIQETFESALRWKVSGDTRYADQAVNFLNAWSSTNTTLTGDADRFLASGLYAFDWAATAEIMRTYSGWSAAGIAQFQNYLLSVYYPLQDSFLTSHNGAYVTNYWANWDLANIEGMMATGIFCDRHDLYTEAWDYLHNIPYVNGNWTSLQLGGNGNLDNMVYYAFSGDQAQWQESGRDQGHTLLGMSLFGDIAQMAWNQGDDLFSYNNNQFLAAAEYVAKYNAWNDVPFEWQVWQYGAPGVWGGSSTMWSVGSGSRGNSTVGYELIYAHYASQGFAAPYSWQRVQYYRPDGWSGNGDSLGWGTLMFAQATTTTGQPPKSLTARENGKGNIELDWFGGLNDTSYNVYRSTSQNGTYSLIASSITDPTTYTDYNVPAGTYYYKVTGVSGGTETAPSSIVSATSGALLQTQLLFNESSGSTAADATGNGWTGTLNGGATWSTGKSGNAVALDGSSGYVSLPANIVQPLGDFTVSTWVYLNSAAMWSRVFDFGNSLGHWMYLTVKNGSGVPEFATSTDYYGNNKQSVAGNAALPLNQWVHLAVTLSGRVGTLYVNGVAVGSNTHMEFAPFEIKDTTQDWLGRSQFSNDPYLNGKIDDFRIYQGAMTTGAIYTQATGNAAPAVPAAPASLTATAVPGGAINVSWSSSSGATSYSLWRATTSGGPYTALATLYPSTSYSDTGVTTGTTYYYVVTAANLGGDSAYSAQASAVALPPMPGIPTNLVAASMSSTSIVLTWSGSSDAASYTIKRSLTSGGPYTPVASGVTATTYTNTGLTSGVTYYYVITAVNAAGESSPSNEDSAMPADLFERLQFDESNGTTAADSTGNSRSGTLVGGPTWTTGKINGAVNLNGSSQYVSLPTGVVSALTSFTISSWVKLTSSSMWMRVFDFGTGTTNYMFLTTMNGSNVPRFAITTGSGEQGINGTAAIPTGVWAHLAVTCSGNLGILYVNGVEVGRNSSMTLNPSSLGSTTGNYLGKSQWNDPYLNGLLDDFRIYSRALSATEIHSLAVPTRPTVATAASASPNPVTGTTAALSVLGADSGGEAKLTYTWTASGPAAVTFSDNGTNTAKNTTITFSRAGSYTFTATIANANGGTSTSSVNVTVNQTLTKITIVPSAAILNVGSTQQFTAYNLDQFGQTIAGAISPTWSISPTSGAGTLSSSGLYTAPSKQVTPTITATSGGFMGSSVVQVFNRDAWTNTAGGSWTTATNWQNSTIANGAGVAADFSTLALSSAATVTLDGARTIADLLFGDTSNTYGWTLNTGSGGPLTLNATSGTPTIVVNNQTATIGTVLAGSQGLTKTGAGTLVLTANNTFSGVTTVSGGMLTLDTSTANVVYNYLDGNVLINNGSTFCINAAGYKFGGTTFTFDSSGGGTFYLEGSGNGGGFSVLPAGITIATTGGARDNISGPMYINTAAQGAAVVTLNVARGTDPTSDLAVSTGFNNSGSVTKTGNGILLLTAASYYSGATTVSAGTLLVANTAGSGTGSGAVTVNSGGTLGGTGTISGAVTVNSGATLSPGTAGIGTLNISNALALNGTTAMEINHSTGGCDHVMGVTTLTYGGTLTVTNLAGTLANSDAFTLFTASTYSGSFSTINLPSLSAGLHWDTSALATSGQIKVVNNPPTVATPVAVAPSGTGFSLAVLGADDGGEANLTYTWSVSSGPGGVTFSPNGTNAAKNSTASLIQAGSYTFTVTITDQGGLATTSSTSVSVAQTLTTISITPTTANLASHATQQFTATAYDQFGVATSSQPTFTWAVATGVGSINSSTGLYTASYASGSATVTASSGAVTSPAATITVTDAAPTVYTPAAASPSTVAGATFALSVLGADSDGGGETNLSYTWDYAGPATVNFSANNNNAAKNTTATLSQAGAYTFTVTITDQGGKSTTSSVNVTISNQAQWNAAASASWSTLGNWMDSGATVAAPGIRGIAGDTVLFAAATGQIASLDGASPTLAAITFNNATTSYTIAQGSGGSLTLQGGSGATVSVLAGSHTISAPLHLAGNTTFSAAATSSLTVSGAIDGSGSLTLSGGGTLYLSGSNRYTGGTSVIGGTLIILNAAALPDGGSLVVGDASLFASAGVVAGTQVSPSAAVSASPTATLSAATSGDVASSSAIVSAASSPATNASPAIPLGSRQQLRCATSAASKGPALPPAAAWRANSKQTWLPAMANVWNKRQQPTGPAKARAVDVVMMTRNS